jgi:hypothetical protein
MPDFYSLSVHAGIPQTGGIVGVGFNASIDRYGNFYWTIPSVSVGFPSATGGSLTGGWLLQRCNPSAEETNSFLTSWGGSATGFTPWFIGGGYARSAGGQAILGGVGFPYGGSVSGGYGIKGLPW